TTFETFSEQAEAKRLLAAALTEGAAHAYLFHGPPGVGKRDFARAFARELLATTRVVHPDLYELEALGEMIRIDAIRELRRDVLIEQARAVYRDPSFDPGTAAAALIENARARGDEAREKEEVKLSGLDLPAREVEQRLKRAQRGAEREELLAQLEELAAWYRDLVAVNVGAERAATHVDRLEELRADATRERLLGA